MAFTEYRFDPDFIAARAEELQRNLRSNRGFSNFLPFGLSVIADRLGKDRRRYLDYGPYWPALKELMNANGYALGEQSDPLICQEYRGKSDAETLVMADEFRTEYLKTNIVYSNRFMLDAESGEFWTLYDSDMETPPA